MQVFLNKDFLGMLIFFLEAIALISISGAPFPMASKILRRPFPTVPTPAIAIFFFF